MAEEEFLTQIEAMAAEICEQCRADAGHCLHLDDEEYWGCCYRKNLEAGCIFYGRNAV